MGQVPARQTSETPVSIAAKKQANPIDVQVGNRVRIRRMLIGMSQERLGDLLGLTFQQVQKYEKGVNRIERDACSRCHASSMCRSISSMKASMRRRYSRETAKA